MEIRKVIIYITRDGALQTSEQKARQHVKRQRRAQTESARTLGTLLRTARPTPEETSPTSRVSQSNEQTAPSFTEGTHKDRILAAINAGHKKTRAIRAVTGIKANVLYADLAKLRSEGAITRTNRLPRARERKPAKRPRGADAAKAT